MLVKIPDRIEDLVWKHLPALDYDDYVLMALFLLDQGGVSYQHQEEIQRILRRSGDLPSGDET